MLKSIRRYFSRAANSSSSSLFPAPDEILSVVGDVHGCARQLKAILPNLPGQIVIVGDIVDRGEETAAVVDLLMERPEILCLMGNHEQMLLSFLDDPERNSDWLRFGGMQTLASYGLGLDLAISARSKLRDKLRSSMGEEQIRWLRSLPEFLISGGVAITHAGADPDRPIEQQSDSLIWGHPKCGRSPRKDGIGLVHGHTIVSEPDIRNGVIRVDTGAYAGGPLTAVFLGDGAVHFEACA